MDYWCPLWWAGWAEDTLFWWKRLCFMAEDEQLPCPSLNLKQESGTLWYILDLITESLTKISLGISNLSLHKRWDEMCKIIDVLCPFSWVICKCIHLKKYTALCICQLCSILIICPYRLNIGIGIWSGTFLWVLYVIVYNNTVTVNKWRDDWKNLKFFMCEYSGLCWVTWSYKFN